MATNDSNRTARLKAALRENMRKRKAQERERDAPAHTPDPGADNPR